ncbi:MAG: hypothetical protein KGM42_10935 [Hyphomicrobiales bacterium]|nr:hypothetical protein [Hyphomicrobiales bacterium]
MATVGEIQDVLRSITEFGDAALIGPATCGLATALWVAGEKRNARNLIALFALCLAIIVVLKVVLMVVWTGGPLRSPSGHSAMSAFLYGSIALMLVASSDALIARLAAAAFGALVLVIAVSRFEIGGHSRTEALVGLAVGLGCALLFGRRSTGMKQLRLATAVSACVAGVAVCVALYWLVAPGYVDEETIWSFAKWLRGVLRTA